MSDVVLVDWLPRGGITQTTAAWRSVAQEAGLELTVVGRAGAEHRPDVAIYPRVANKVGAMEAHLRLVARAVRVIRDLRPRVVYVQHTWLPIVEVRVLEAAHAVGARTVLALHNARPHDRLRGGLMVGLDRLLARADDLVVHSHFVARQLERPDAHVLPLPEHLPITRAPALPVAGLERTDQRRAVAFGVLRRGYKGAHSLADLAAALGPRWEVVAAGVGADRAGPGVRTRPGYLAPGELRWLVEQADVVLLPYQHASQSGAVSVAQSIGTPPVASAVGGIPEQIDDGRTGVLVAARAGPDVWVAAVEPAAALDRLTIRTVAAEQHERAARAWLALVRTEAPA